MTPAFLFALALVACAFTKATPGGRPAFNWSQKLLGAVAVVVAMVILLNPELLALGLIGDAAFFDFLVLLVGLQLQSVSAQIQTFVATLFSRLRHGSMRWFMSRRLSYLMIRWTFTLAGLWMIAAVGHAMSTIQKVAHRILS